jgi:sulfatase modifying factor 1
VHCLLALCAFLLAALPAAAIEIDFVEVGDPGNAPDDTGRGAVGYVYAISRYEITNAQWVAFLNSVATETDVHELYNPDSAGIDFPPVPVGFEPAYEVVPGFENRPVDSVSVYDAFRFANWLQNGQQWGAAGVASTETGAYTMEFSRLSITRQPGAVVFVPSADEWYKAAYYVPASGGPGGYYDYPAHTNTVPACWTPTAAPDTANCESAANGTTPVGSYPASASPFGTFDQGGNVYEWTETISGAGEREVRGGNWFSTASSQASSSFLSLDADTEQIGYGFRVAMRVPEPAQSLLGAAGALALAALSAGRRPN